MEYRIKLQTLVDSLNYLRKWSVALIALAFCLLSPPCLIAQKKSSEAYVDKNGVLRWGQTDEEIKAFGINYTAMFAHAYRTAKKWNVPIEKAIEDDIYHFSRLGFDLFRVHVWDTEISDTVGNLIENENLRLFDFALKKMQERGMKFVITPIAYWGNGWPERDDKTPGFSRKYGKDKSLTTEGAIKAQETYLFQFLNHVNKYTGFAYKNDPSIIAFEISNEPHHQEAPEKVTEFINRMVAAMRKSGTKKPILYNISHSIHLADAYFKSNIQGGTFQWYPTNLGAGHELKGNLLPNVERYNIPFANAPGFRKMAKIVYEFDAADVGRSYIYPAMARSFRSAGIQIATQFAYDPTFMANVNTEYGTHYMNLVYAPQKALSLMIAGEVFRQIPMNKDFGAYPVNTSFGDFRISYEKDLAEMISPKKFLYTNNTDSKVDGANLEKIAGFGNSSIIHYDGSGAYFLDKLENGVWRLEVMPDAIWKYDPFEKTSLKKKIAFIHWKPNQISIDLLNLGENYSIKGVNDGNHFSDNASRKSFIVSPGTYMLIRQGVVPKVKLTDRVNNFVVKEFSAPTSSLNETIVKHKPLESLSVGSEHRVEAHIYDEDSIQSVELFASAPGSWMEKIAMQKTDSYTYSTTIPARFAGTGFLRYHVVVRKNDKNFTYPSGLETHPWDWDFYARESYTVPVVEAKQPVVLFSPISDTESLMRPWLKTFTVVPFGNGSGELVISIDKLFTPDPENKNAEVIDDYSFRLYVGDKIDGRKKDFDLASKIIVRGRSNTRKDQKLQVALVTKNGLAFGGIVTLTESSQDYEVMIKDLKPVKLVSLPRPYPTFLSYFSGTTPADAKLTLADVESLQVSIGPGMNDNEIKGSHAFSIESIRVE